MVAAVGTARSPETISFLDENFAKVAFAVAAVSVFFLQTLSFFFGLFAGFFLHYHFEPDRVVAKEEIITVFHSTFAIIAAAAALIKLTPGGAAGGFIFQSIAPLFSTAFGSSAFLAYRSCS